MRDILSKEWYEDFDSYVKKLEQEKILNRVVNNFFITSKDCIECWRDLLNISNDCKEFGIPQNELFFCEETNDFIWQPEGQMCSVSFRVANEKIYDTNDINENSFDRPLGYIGEKS